MYVAVLLALATVTVPPPLVPGGCTAPAAEHEGAAGCYLAGEMTLERAPPSLYWHIVEFATAAAANDEAARHLWSRVVTTHGRVWLFVMGGKRIAIDGSRMRAVVGPMAVPPGDTATVRFLTSNFPPGMRTRVHSHPGSEAFYVVDGEQCVETPTARHRIRAGGSFIVPGGLHMQASAKGRRSVVALILRPDALWSVPEAGWTPGEFCDR